MKHIQEMAMLTRISQKQFLRDVEKARDLWKINTWPKGKEVFATIDGYDCYCVCRSERIMEETYQAVLKRAEQLETQEG